MSGLARWCERVPYLRCAAAAAATPISFIHHSHLTLSVFLLLCSFSWAGQTLRSATPAVLTAYVLAPL